MPSTYAMLVPQSPSRIAALRSQPNTRGRLVESSIRGVIALSDAHDSKILRKSQFVEYSPYSQYIYGRRRATMRIPFLRSLRFKVGAGYIVLVVINVAVTAWAI